MKDLRFLVRRQFMSISSLYDDTENGGDDIRLFYHRKKLDDGIKKISSEECKFKHGIVLRNRRNCLIIHQMMSNYTQISY